MAYSSAQEARIRSAQTALDNARSARDVAWSGGDGAYSWIVELQKCNSNAGIARDAKGTISSYILGDKRGDCSNATWKARKEAFMNAFNRYNGLQQIYLTKQVEYDKILAEIASEVASDPAVIAESNQIIADADVAKNKWTFFGLAVLLSLGIVAFMWFKTETKKLYLIGGEITFILLLYVLFFGFNKK